MSKHEGPRAGRSHLRAIGDVFSPHAWIRLTVGFVTAFAAGAIIALVVQRGGGWVKGTHWDVDILERTHTALPAWLDTILMFIPWLGTNITIFAVLIPFTIWLYRRNRADVIAQLWTATLGNYFLNVVMKFAFGRPRPSLWPRRGEYSWAAYPSGHMIAMVSVLLFGAWLLHRERGDTWAYVVWAPTFVAMLYSRLYLGVHWPTDVVAGVAMGAVWLTALWLTFRRPDWRGTALVHPAVRER